MDHFFGKHLREWKAFPTFSFEFIMKSSIVVFFLVVTLPYRHSISTRTSATMERHLILSLVGCNNSAGLRCPPATLVRPSLNSSYCLPFVLQPSTIPVSTTASVSFVLITCPRNLICCLLIGVIISFTTPIYLSTSSLVLVVHDIFKILIHCNISAASNISCIFLFIIQISHP